MSNLSNPSNGKVLVRPKEGRVVAGVCAGLADYLGLDVNLVRILAAVLTVFTAGAGGVLVYLVAWAVIPEEGHKTSVAEDLINSRRR
jgi:phage shock protein PspC (stress-responsive transcriptional regulator)